MKRLAARRGEGERGDDRDERDPAREAIEAVDEVQGIDDAGDPEDREGQAEDAELDLRAERVRDDVDAIAERVHRAGDRELDEELGLRVRALEVVEDAERRDGEPAGEEAERLARVRVEAAADVAVHEEERSERREEREDDGDAAELRDGLPVDLARGEGVVERPEAVGEPADDGREGHTGDCGGDEGNTCGLHAILTIFSAHAGACPACRFAFFLITSRPPDR